MEHLLHRLYGVPCRRPSWHRMLYSRTYGKDTIR